LEFQLDGRAEQLQLKFLFPYRVGYIGILFGFVVDNYCVFVFLN